MIFQLLCQQAMCLHGRKLQVNHLIQLPRLVRPRRIILIQGSISQQEVMQRVRINTKQRILLRIVLTALLLIQKKALGMVKLQVIITTIQYINLKVAMHRLLINMQQLTLRTILHIDLSQIRKKMLGIVRRQEITTTIQHTNPRVVMLQVLINIQRRTLKKIRLIVL